MGLMVVLRTSPEKAMWTAGGSCEATQRRRSDVDRGGSDVDRGGREGDETDALRLAVVEEDGRR